MHVCCLDPACSANAENEEDLLAFKVYEGKGQSFSIEFFYLLPGLLVLH